MAGGGGGCYCYAPDMYCDSSSFPTATSSLPRGFHRAWTRMLSFGPGTMETFSAVALPRMEPLLRRLIFTYGTLAVYSVGLVILILASIVRLSLVVSTTRKAPTLGLKPARLPPEIAEREPF